MEGLIASLEERLIECWLFWVPVDFSTTVVILLVLTLFLVLLIFVDLVELTLDSTLILLSFPLDITFIVWGVSTLSCTRL